MISRPRTLVFGLAVAAALAAVWLAAPRTRGQVRVPPPPGWPTGVPLAKNAAVGMSGCLAAACHGGPAADLLSGKPTDPVWPASGTAWVAGDPHAGAYDALVREKTRLGGPSAARIMTKLGSGFLATEDARCLACHTNPSLAEPGPATDPQVVALRREGVSCEACHGNAGGWLYRHTTGDFSATAPLTEVGNRATACLGCHVGAPADPARNHPVRDMNHDMIAAGHPRLNFDFAEYHRRLPKHWREKHATPLTPVREWFVGRVAHAEAACRLLADRARRAQADDARTPWPEFAEFDCAACHQKIVPQPGRNPPTADRSPGSLRWQTIWPVVHGGGTDAGVLLNVLAVTQARRPPDPGDVLTRAEQAAKELGEFRTTLARLPDDELVRKATPLIYWSGDVREDWDQAGQVLQGLFRLGRIRPGKEPGEFGRARDAFRLRDWPATRDVIDALMTPEVRPAPPAGRENPDRK